MESNKEKIRIYIIIALLAVIAIWYLFSGTDVSTERGRIDNIRNELATTEKQQQSAIDRLGKIENGITDSQERVNRTETAIGNAEERIKDGEARVKSSAELIDECQSILRTVRARGEK